MLYIIATFVSIDIYYLYRCNCNIYIQVNALQSIVHITLCAMQRHNSALKCMNVSSELIQRSETYGNFNSPRRRIILPGFMPYTRERARRNNRCAREKERRIYWNTTDFVAGERLPLPHCSHDRDAPLSQLLPMIRGTVAEDATRGR